LLLIARAYYYIIGSMELITSEGDKNLKNLILKTELLNHLDTELIGNGGNSRLDIMLDLETGELWADEFYSHEEGSYQDYHDENIICVGKATNGIVLDDNDEEDSGGKCFWNITIYPVEKDYNNPYDNFKYCISNKS
jgi:hypothetical protein